VRLHRGDSTNFSRQENILQGAAIRNWRTLIYRSEKLIEAHRGMLRTQGKFYK